MSKERRKYMRFDTAINGEFTVVGTDVKGLFITDNFSRGGFKAGLNRTIEQDSSVELELTFPETIMPMFATGKVVWTNTRHEGSSKTDVGVQLEQIDPVERRCLIDYCYKNWNQARTSENKTEFSINV